MNGNNTHKRGQRRIIIGIGYPLLITAALCTMAPLLWLLSSSFKTADEVFAVPIQWFPKLPPRVSSSPFILSEAYPKIHKPDSVSLDEWNILLPELRQVIWSKSLPYISDTPYLTNSEQSEFQNEMIEGIWQQHFVNLPSDIWKDPKTSIVNQIAQTIIPETVKTIQSNVSRQVSVGIIEIEDKDFNRIKVESVDWFSESISFGKITESQNSTSYTNLSYSFKDNSKIILSTSIPIRIPIERIRRIILPVHGDSSYHQLSLNVRANNTTYESVRPYVLATALWNDSVWRINGIPGELESTQIPMRRSVSDQKMPKTKGNGEIVDPTQEAELFLNLTIHRPAYLLIAWNKLTSNYRKLWKSVPFNKYFINSVFIATASTLMTLFFCSLGGYAFAKYQFRGKKILFGILLASMMIPFQVLLVPLFGLMYKIGWLNSYRAIIIPFSVGAFGVFLMRQFIVTIPSELIDAARIDGCSEFGIYYRIVLPIIKPALGALTIYSFLGSWNGYLWPLIVLRDEEKYTLPIGLANLIGTYRQEYGMLMAGTLLSLTPIVILFLAMQREFVQGITLGSVKE